MAKKTFTVSPVKVGEIHEITIDRLGNMAEGVGRIENFTVFVPGLLPHEKAKIKITEVKSRYAKGHISEIVQSSPDRVRPHCGIYEACGGCQLQHLSYQAQLELKRSQVNDLLVHIGGMQKIPVLPTLGADDPWYYRNKMQLPVGTTKGKLQMGCYALGTHLIIDTDECFIQDSLNNQLTIIMREIIEKLHIPIYNEDKHTGVIRHIVGRVGLDDKLMVILVTATRELKQAGSIVRMLRQRIPQIVSIQQNIQTYHNNVILGRETKVLWGKPTILAKLGDLIFHVSARSFFQVNTNQAARLYAKALEFADLKGYETVIDAYCGTGTITLYLAQKARKVIGIEIVKPAIVDAEKNARDNNIHNAEFIVGDATEVMPRLAKQGIRPDVVVVDPPRAGCTELILQTFAKLGTQRIVYVSCNPATLARDISILSELGYKAIKVQPVDMFPMTAHVECVALINKVK